VEVGDGGAVGGDETANVGEMVEGKDVKVDAEEDPYHVPNYFHLSEVMEGKIVKEEEEAKSEFDPPLIHYAEP
jgi:hypothetical protein